MTAAPIEEVPEPIVNRYEFTIIAEAEVIKAAPAELEEDEAAA